MNYEIAPIEDIHAGRLFWYPANVTAHRFARWVIVQVLGVALAKMPQQVEITIIGADGGSFWTNPDALHYQTPKR